MKKYIVLLILFINYSNLSFAQKNQLSSQILPIIDTNQFIGRLCGIGERDQSNLDFPLIRQQLFFDNMDTIKEIISTYGFPQFAKLSNDKSMWPKMEPGIPMTFVHVCQSNRSDLLVDVSFIKLIKREIDAGRLERERLKEYLFFWYTGFKSPCIDLKDDVEFALKEWGLPLIEDSIYKTCEFEKK